jgi:serine/threonine protein kinase
VGSITEEHNRASHLMINQGQSSRQSLDSLMNQNGPRVSTFSPEMTSNLGTTAWCAPELLTTASKTHYSVKVDVYSFGMVLWELWEKKRPFDEYNSRFDIMDAIRAGKRPEISSNCPPSYRSLLQRCWQTNPTRRPNFTYIVRYLKDELALVKRKRGATGGGMAAGMIGYRGDIFMSTSAPSYTPEQLGRESKYHILLDC